MGQKKTYYFIFDFVEKGGGVDGGPEQAGRVDLRVESERHGHLEAGRHIQGEPQDGAHGRVRQLTSHLTEYVLFLNSVHSNFFSPWFKICFVSLI